MNVTIIHRPGCPLCEAAIREFAGDGHEVELYGSLTEMPASEFERKIKMMTDLLRCDVDIDALPQVFIHDRYIPWQPKKGA